MKKYLKPRGKQVRTFFISGMVMVLLASTGCATQGKTKKDNEKNKVYITDLNGDGIKETVETKDKFSTDFTSIVTIKNKKGAETDSFPVSGKIGKIEFADLNNDGVKQIAAYSEDEEGITTLTIYQSNDDKFYKIFSVASAYTIDTDFGLVSRIKVGKAARRSNPSNFSLEWDKWIWVGNGFIME